ncbi:class F sortase [Oryzobacter terrae]|uniref:class F sortase n=1 Tax=Oryzobacter terrae TaxID=1620385 RepID=UPI00366BDD7C
MTRTPRPTRWAAVSAGAAVVAVLAVVALVAWVLARPGASEGAELAQVRGSPTASASPSGPGPSPSFSPPPTRDATLGSLASRDTPAPSRLRIPDLDVDATVTGVGVQADGAMVIPAAPTSVGWYRFGSAPADPEGHTVIAGHVATREDGPGALAALRSARPGMRVVVTTADGTEHAYEVRGREAIVKKALPVDEIFARDGRPLLVLITCGGEYLPELRSHRDNVVVTAVPV